MRISAFRWLQAGSLAFSLAWAGIAWGANPPAAATAKKPLAKKPAAKVVPAAYQEAANQKPSVLARQPEELAPRRPAPAAPVTPPTMAVEPEAIEPLEMLGTPDHIPSYGPQRGRQEIIHEALHGEASHAPCFGDECWNRPCSPGNMWISANYMLWWRSGMDLPPLVTTATPGTAQPVAGVIGNPNTTVLFGNEHERFPVRPGGRVEAGWWLDHTECFGLGGRFYWLGDAEFNYAASSTGTPILAIPFLDASNNTPAARLIGFPGTFNGNLNFHGDSEVIGGDAFGRMKWCCTSWGRIDLIAGYQFARINEGLVLDSTANDNLGARNRVIDNFATYNEFHGGVVGFTTQIDRGCYYIDLLAKVGLGNMQQQVTITGQSISTVGANTTVVNNSGIFAQSTNVGTYERDQFTIIPELGVNVGWHLTSCLDLNLGYTFIYVSNVVRPGDAIDTVVDSRLIGGGTAAAATRPDFAFNDDGFFLHGLNLGLTLRF